ncbi:glycosyltransferase family 2 protein [Belliella sp. DSM 111904]|uniref:Glycosyltransferase family 2 protein n=1 Tax=Belliella filtrata TaxID=2923435 RepID=A0ABS9UXG8_9BACT|nr:glycosyltransferase family A protein [Belliella filtrata]MCH7408645.1 glycosyltransferase family 2 protein [Belliella filtrata]
MDSEKKLISILIPNYNKELFLRETLNSVLFQTHTNWECIIVDDHSTDNSWEILEEYANKDSRFEIYKRPLKLSKGATSCRNFALEQSKGEMIQYLDSDDILEHNKILNQLNCFQDYESILISNWEYFGRKDANKFLSKYKLEQYPESIISLFEILWNEQKFIPVFCFLIPRKLIQYNWRPNLLKNQDGDFFFNILMTCENIVYVKKSIGYYRVPDSNHISGIKSIAAFRSDFIVINSYERILKENEKNLKIVSGIIQNYVGFILRVLDKSPALAKLAWMRIVVLDPNFRMLKSEKMFFKYAKKIGFDFSLLIRIIYQKIRLKVK